MKRLITGFILIFFVFPALVAQDETPEELFYDAKFFYDEEEYAEAAYLYRQLIQREPENANAKHLIGMCYIEIAGEAENAIPMFLEATEQINLRYK